MGINESQLILCWLTIDHSCPKSDFLIKAVGRDVLEVPMKLGYFGPEVPPSAGKGKNLARPFNFGALRKLTFSNR
jgi:hypothetical protein